MTTYRPFVGPPTEGAGCAYSADLARPACEQPSTVHLLVDSDWGVVALAACSAHAEVARNVGLGTHAEHAYTPTCATLDCWGLT